MGTDNNKNSKSERKARRVGAPLRTIGFVALIVAVLALPIGGYALYVVGQLKAVEAQNLRTLAQAAGTLEAVVDNLKMNVENLGKKPGYACEFQAIQTRLSLKAPGTCEELGGWGFAEATKAEITQRDAGLLIGLESTGTDNKPMSWSVRFDKILSDIPFGNSMDALLIADDKGRVVTQHPNSAIGSGGAYPSISDEEVASRSLARRGVRVTNLALLELLNDSTINLDELVRGTSVRSVLIAGTGYKMLCQPLVLNLSDAQVNRHVSDSWVLCGLTEESRALREALEVAPFLTLFLFASFFFALFLWPIAKVLTMSARERFRFSDVYLLLLGTWGAVMLVIVLSVTIDTYIDLDRQTAESLRKLATDIDQNLTRELEQANSQLQLFDKELHRKLREALTKGLTSEQKDLDKVLFPDLGDRTQLLTRSWPPDEITPAGSIYPYLTSIFLAEPCSGGQIAKRTIRDSNTPKVSVAARAYFQKVQQDDLWAPPCERCKSLAEYYLQTDRSVTTGEFFAAVSIPSAITRRDSGPSPLETFWSEVYNKDEKDRYAQLREESDGTCPATPRAAAVMVGQLVSVTNPVLAPGVGFAILDRDGSVVFHSDERRVNFENFFEGLGDGERLAGLLQAGLEGDLKSNYGARPHLIHAQPMANVPLSIVTFMDSEILRTSILESLMQSSMMMLVHLACYLIASLVFLLFIGRRSPAWMWPYVTMRVSDYQWLAWLFVTLILGASLVIRSIDGTELNAFCLLLPIIPILVVLPGAWILKQRSSDMWVIITAIVGGGVIVIAYIVMITASVPEESADPSTYALPIAVLVVGLAGATLWNRRGSLKSGTAGNASSAAERRGVLAWSIAVAVLMWIVVAVLPAYGYTKTAIGDQLKVLVKYENVVMSHRLIDRDAQVREFYMSIAGADDVLEKRLETSQPDIYRLALFTNAHCGPDNDQTGSDSQCNGGIRVDSRPTEGPGKDFSGSPVVAAYPWSEVAVNLPIYNETSRGMRHLQQHIPGAPDDRWHMTGDAELMFKSDRYARGSTVRIDSVLPITGPVTGYRTLVSSLLGLLAIVFWCRYAARHLFFGSVTPQSLSKPTAEIMTVHDLIRQPPYERVWAVINSPEDMKLITQSTNTCSLAAVLLREESESVPEEGPVFLTDFESSYRRDVDLLRARLSGVLGRLEGRVVVIVAARSMHSVLYRHGEEEDPEKEIPGELHGFFEVQVALARAKTYEPKFAGLSPRRGLYKKTTKEWVTREISAIEGFNEVLETGIEDLAMRYGTRKEALHFIVQKARPYYQSIWDDCTDDERLVLAQLAQEGVANPKQAEAVHSLLNRGVLAKDPVLRVMNHSFAIFASQAFGADEVKRMEQSIGGIHWAHTRLILLGLLLALLLFLSTTQPAAVENLTRFLTGAVASLAAIITVANKLSGLRINVSES